MVITWLLTGPFLYLAAALFVVETAWRVVALARMPRHLRWELYPLAHLGPAGSKYQKVDYAGQPRHVNRLADAAFMAGEILLLKKVFSHRRDLWLGSYLLHVGLYLSLAFLVLVALGRSVALLKLLGSPEAGWLLGDLVRRAAWLLGLVGTAMGAVGAAMLLRKRLADRGLRDMSDAVTFFNLGLLLAMFVAGLLAVVSGDQRLAAPLAALLLGVFLVYLPLSRMFHFAAKYFFYHAVLWDDAAMRPGSAMEQDIAACLQYRTTWSAAHAQPQASWLEQASAAREKGDKGGR